MSKIKELTEQRGQIVRRLNEMSDAVANDQRAFKPEETDEFDSLNDQQLALKDQIETLTRCENAKALVLPKSENRSVASYKPNPIVSERDHDLAFRAWALRASGNGRLITADMKSAVERTDADIYGDVYEARQQSTVVGEGGYTKNSNIFSGIVEARKAYGGMMENVSVLNTQSGESLAFAYNDDTGNTGGWTAELVDIDNTSYTFTQVTLGAWSVTSGVYPVSLQIVQDSQVDFSGFTGRILGQRLGRQINTALTSGNGSSKPTGFLASATSAYTAAATTALTIDELADLYFSLDAAYRPNAKFMMNSTVWATLIKLKDDNLRPLLIDGYNGQPFSTLFGKPVVINEDMPAMTAGLKPVAFGDFSAYQVRTVGGPQVAVDRSLYFKSLGLAFIAYERLDGKLLDAKAIKYVTMHA